MLGLIKMIGEEEKKERGKGIWEWTREEFIEEKGGEEQVDEKYYYYYYYCFS